MFPMKPKKGKKEKDIEGIHKVQEMSDAMHTENHSDIPTDVLGSYTGNPYDGSTPTQDADDL